MGLCADSANSLSPVGATSNSSNLLLTPQSVAHKPFGVMPTTQAPLSLTNPLDDFASPTTGKFGHLLIINCVWINYIETKPIAFSKTRHFQKHFKPCPKWTSYIIYLLSIHIVIIFHILIYKSTSSQIKSPGSSFIILECPGKQYNWDITFYMFL